MDYFRKYYFSSSIDFDNLHCFIQLSKGLLYFCSHSDRQMTSFVIDMLIK